MILAGAAALLLLAWGGGQSGPRPPAEAGLSVRHQIIVRVSRGGPAAAPAGAAPVRWRESRGPRCVAARQVLGATLLGQDSVDLVLRDNRRLRARLERRCPALDYYRGFYIQMAEDGRICADRDSIRSRAGGECRIDQFRALTAERR